MTATTWNLDVRCGALLKRNKCLVTQRTSAAGKMGAPSTVEPPTRCPLLFCLFCSSSSCCVEHTPKLPEHSLRVERHRHHPVQALCVVACLIWLGFIEGAPLLRSVTDLFVFPSPSLPHPALPLIFVLFSFYFYSRRFYLLRSGGSAVQQRLESSLGLSLGQFCFQCCV